MTLLDLAAAVHVSSFYVGHIILQIQNCFLLSNICCTLGAFVSDTSHFEICIGLNHKQFSHDCFESTHVAWYHRQLEASQSGNMGRVTVSNEKMDTWPQSTAANFTGLPLQLCTSACTSADLGGRSLHAKYNILKISFKSPAQEDDDTFLSG